MHSNKALPTEENMMISVAAVEHSSASLSIPRAKGILEQSNMLQITSTPANIEGKFDLHH